LQAKFDELSGRVLDADMKREQQEKARREVHSTITITKHVPLADSFNKLESLQPFARIIRMLYQCWQHCRCRLQQAPVNKQSTLRDATYCITLLHATTDTAAAAHTDTNIQAQTALDEAVRDAAAKAAAWKARESQLEAALRSRAAEVEATRAALRAAADCAERREREWHRTASDTDEAREEVHICSSSCISIHCSLYLYACSSTAGQSVGSVFDIGDKLRCCCAGQGHSAAVSL
jgi:hypothetical protein